MTVRERLLKAVVAARDREAAELWARCDDSPREPGRWTARDNVAHLSAWRRHAAASLAAVRVGGPAPVEDDDFDAQNARIFEAVKDLSAAAVLAEAAASWDALRAELGTCTEADLHRERPGRPGREAWEVVPGNAHQHVAEHLGYWYAEHGDEAAAEQAARWAHDLDIETLEGDRVRGIAEYNLGCFYARRGRAAEAVPHLRRGLELLPDTLAWAREDRDLDNIRADPALAALLAG